MKLFSDDLCVFLSYLFGRKCEFGNQASFKCNVFMSAWHTGLNAEIPKSEFSLEEREAAYLAARERIFSVDECGTGELVKQRPPNNPTVARRMIAHALGQRIKPRNDDISFRNSNACGEQVNNMMIQNEEDGAFNSDIEVYSERNAMPDKNLNSIGKINELRLSDSESSYSGTKIPQNKIDKLNKFCSSGSQSNQTNVRKDNFKEEHMGAAKRMFVNALGFHPRNGNFSRSRQTNWKRMRLELVLWPD